jgi:hypothetical protein
MPSAFLRPWRALSQGCYGRPFGPLATIVGEPRQARKGATVVNASCAEVWLFGRPPFRVSVALVYPVTQVLIQSFGNGLHGTST